MSCEQVRTLLADYSVGRLYGWQARRLKSHLSQCPHCQQAWGTFQQVLSLVKDVPERDVPSEMWSGIQQRLRQREAQQPTRAWQVRLSPPLTYAGAVAAVLVFGLATFSGYVNRSASLSLAPNRLDAAGFYRPPLRGGAFTLPAGSFHAASPVTDEDIERLAKVTPQRPTVVPAGYQFEASDLYRCNCCGRGGCAAILRYTNGKSRLYVLECRPDQADCEDASHHDPATFGNPCLLCRLGKGSLVEVKSPSLRLAVIGDLPRSQLLAVAYSVKKE